MPDFGRPAPSRLGPEITPGSVAQRHDREAQRTLMPLVARAIVPLWRAMDADVAASALHGYVRDPEELTPGCSMLTSGEVNAAGMMGADLA